MNMEKKFTPPEGSEILIRNLERRQDFLARVSHKEKEEIPEIVIKDTFLRFLKQKYKNLSEDEIHDLNNRVFMMLNRAASIANKKQDTAPVTSMFSFTKKGVVGILEKEYQEFKNQMKSIIELCEQYKVSLKSITGMQYGLGMPDIVELTKLVQWCKDKGIDLKSITGMQNGLGTPDVARRIELLKLIKRSTV